MSNVIDLHAIRMKASDTRLNERRAVSAVRRAINELQPYAAMPGISNAIADLLYLTVKVDPTTPK